jgi:hypothetical protein
LRIARVIRGQCATVVNRWDVLIITHDTPAKEGRHKGRNGTYRVKGKIFYMQIAAGIASITVDITRAGHIFKLAIVEIGTESIVRKHRSGIIELHIDKCTGPGRQCRTDDQRVFLLVLEFTGSE